MVLFSNTPFHVPSQKITEDGGVYSDHARAAWCCLWRRHAQRYFTLARLKPFALTFSLARRVEALLSCIWQHLNPRLTLHSFCVEDIVDIALKPCRYRLNLVEGGIAFPANVHAVISFPTEKKCTCFYVMLRRSHV